MIHLSLIIILTLCGVQSMKNGRRADGTEFPFVVSIQHQLFHLCSGTIIDAYHILTVAHVVVPYKAPDLIVVPGMSVVRWPCNTTLSVKNIYPHPHYRDWTLLAFGQSDLYWANDIAILRLTEPLPLTSLIGPVPFSTANFESYRCFDCTMISWSYPDESNLETVVLMWDVVFIVNNNRCEQWAIRVLANQQCFIDLVETAFISTEDLGSPIMCGGSMVGLIVKEARQGEAASPATFLFTLNYMAFISEIVTGGEMDVQPGEFPYMVSIWRGNTHECGGIILNIHQVITTAQCIRNSRYIYRKEEFKIAAGSNRVSLFDDSTQWYLVKHMEVHPYYLPSYYVNNSSCRADHYMALITVSIPFSWSPTVQSFRLADVDDFSTKQLCQVLHWAQRTLDTEHGREYVKLTKKTAVLVDDRESLAQLRRFQIAVKELYSMNSPAFTDIGNPIICRGHPFGIMVRINAINVESHNSPLIFLLLRPYVSM